jgi:hypothetical protein
MTERKRRRERGMFMSFAFATASVFLICSPAVDVDANRASDSLDIHVNFLLQSL